MGKIGTAVNTDYLEKERDALDVTDPHYEKKVLDLQRRYDAQYDVITEAEIQIEDV